MCLPQRVKRDDKEAVVDFSEHMRPTRSREGTHEEPLGVAQYVAHLLYQ